MEVHQPAWGGHQDVGSPLQASDLGIDLYPTENHVTTQVEVVAIGLDVLRHLGSQFPGGGEHQRPHNPGAGGGAMAQPLEHRQGEASGFAGARLGSSHHIVASQNSRNALTLDW